MSANDSLPLVSVMIPTYNRPEMFALTLESALSQTYPNVEILVTDNSTNEDTAKLMNYYKNEPRITYLRNREAKSKAENFAPFEQLAKGEYLQWLMDDDILAPEKISKMAEVLMAYPEVTVVTSQRGKIDGEGRDLGVHSRIDFLQGDYQIFRGDKAGRAMFIPLRNFIGEPSAVLFRRRDLTHHYWRAESKGYLALSDVAMWLELLEKGHIAIFKEPLSWLRVHAGQESQQPDTCLLAFLEWEGLMTEYFQKKVYLTNLEEYQTALRGLRDDWKAYEADCFARGSETMVAKYKACTEKIDKILLMQDEK